ncbi:MULTISPECIES: hypothetical protein [Sorangium]|uniref:PE-PGRS family protein n=1 Tax=Sorangium cellulosum TaxID=56 RepID=A0A4P2QTF0_SORCE|nr:MULTISPECIES: hypothetical protein [Sorangium]AUX33614.1 hypothetical protein SOCE836_057750 [Sorangium cellulosum]WCQ92926.1 hypothetical protein NQZ70_05672 [Sorangium sp. Soce836]
MRITAAIHLSPVLLLVAAGCGTAPGPSDAGGAACDGASWCPGDAPPESVCLERLAAGVLENGCGVFVAGMFGNGDDTNPGTTRDKPVRTLQRGVELARTGRGRVFACNDGFYGPLELPSGVDLIGGYHCLGFARDPGGLPTLQIVDTFEPILTVVPAGPGDTGAADGVSTLVDMRFSSHGPIGMLVQSGTAVELLRGRISASWGWGGRDGEKWPYPNMAAEGPDGQYGGDACSAAVVAGAPAPVNPCEGGIPSVGGKGGDGLPDGAGDGEDGLPFVASSPTSGRGGSGDVPGVNCVDGAVGRSGAQGAIGAAGKGMGRITEAGWEGDKAGDGSRGMPGQGGGGGGGRRGGLSACGAASKGGAGGGSGGAGGCGGRGGQGGENAWPSIAIVALHAKLTVRDTEIVTAGAGQGGDGGPPERGGLAGRGAPGGALGDGMWSCQGGNGGEGGPGGYGGPGRGGDSIGIAYLDEDQLTLEGVSYELGLPGKGGVSWDIWTGDEVTGEDGIQVETQRFPE